MKERNEIEMRKQKKFVVMFSHFKKKLTYKVTKHSFERINMSS